MFLIRARIAPSPIHGLGVFTLEKIPKGAPVWQFTPGFDLDLDPALVADQPEPQRDRLLHYGYVDPRLNRYILCCDDARFLNHSDAPNLLPDYSADRYGIDRAARDIEAGEELTVNYALVEGRSPTQAFPCDGHH